MKRIATYLASAALGAALLVVSGSAWAQMGVPWMGCPYPFFSTVMAIPILTVTSARRTQKPACFVTRHGSALAVPAAYGAGAPAARCLAAVSRIRTRGIRLRRLAVDPVLDGH
jgi:hypothetical protein